MCEALVAKSWWSPPNLLRSWDKEQFQRLVPWYSLQPFQSSFLLIQPYISELRVLVVGYGRGRLWREAGKLADVLHFPEWT